MANYVENGGYCQHCEEKCVVRRRSPNHVLHLLLTCFTLGFWALIWLGSAVQVGGWRCSKCGSKATTRVPRSARRAKALA
jgi:hypothetical protein